MTAGDPGTTLVVRRFLPFPRARVFAAWLDPASLAEWMCPGAVTHTVAEIDPRVGGRYRIVMQKPGGDIEHSGEYLAIDRPSRLSFTWMSVNTDRQPTIVTIDFMEKDGGTELVLTHRRLPPAMVGDHTKGWTDIVGKLERALAKSA